MFPVKQSAVSKTFDFLYILWIGSDTFYSTILFILTGISTFYSGFLELRKESLIFSFGADAFGNVCLELKGTKRSGSKWFVPSCRF